MKPSPALHQRGALTPGLAPGGVGPAGAWRRQGKIFPDSAPQTVLPALPPLPRSIHTPQVQGLPETFQLTLATGSHGSRPHQAVNVVSRPLSPKPPSPPSTLAHGQAPFKMGAASCHPSGRMDPPAGRPRASRGPPSLDWAPRPIWLCPDASSGCPNSTAGGPVFTSVATAPPISRRVTIIPDPSLGERTYP